MSRIYLLKGPTDVKSPTSERSTFDHTRAGQPRCKSFWIFSCLLAPPLNRQNPRLVSTYGDRSVRLLVFVQQIERCCFCF